MVAEQIQMNYTASLSPRARGDGEVMTHEEQHILSLLRRGRENALSVPFLASMVGMSGVRLRTIVRHLIIEHRVGIGSHTGGKEKLPGYFLLAKEKEIDAVYKSLSKRGIRILQRAAELKKISLEEVFHQGRIEFNGGGSA